MGVMDDVRRLYETLTIEGRQLNGTTCFASFRLISCNGGGADPKRRL
jgi:hypothetical protein